MQGRVAAVSIAGVRGELKREVPGILLVENFGIKGDGHAGDWKRQVSCLDLKSLQNLNRELGLGAGPGDFAENILIEGLDLAAAGIGDRLVFSSGCVLEVAQIGKEDTPSVVTRRFGISLLPKEGLFCRVLAGGELAAGDGVVLQAKGRD